MALDRARDTLGQRPMGGSSGDASALEDAGATLVRASAFLRAPLRASGGIPERSRAYLACNALRELDRFLNVLVDEAAAALDAEGLSRLRNVPNKVRALHALLDLPSPGHERLRAIGRVRECLHQRQGEADGEAIWRDFALAVGPAGEAATRGPWLALGPPDLSPICAFYEAITIGVVAAVQARVKPSPRRGEGAD